MPVGGCPSGVAGPQRGPATLASRGGDLLIPWVEPWAGGGWVDGRVGG